MDAGATAGGAGLAGPMAADGSMHGDRAVTAPLVALSRSSSAGSTVEEERSAALATFDQAFRALQQLKYTPRKRKSIKNVLGEVKINAARMGSNARIFGFSNPFSVRRSAELRTARMRFVDVSDVELSSQVRQTMNACFDDLHYFSGCSLQADKVTMDAVMAIFSKCAVKAGLCNAAALLSMKQFILELRRVNYNISAYFSRYVSRLYRQATKGVRTVTSIVTALPSPAHEHDCARVRPAPQDAMRAQSFTTFGQFIRSCPFVSVLSVLFCPFLKPVTLSDPASAIPRPENIGVWGGGGAFGLLSTREHRFMLLGGARRAPGSRADCVKDIVGACVAGLLESVGRTAM